MGRATLLTMVGRGVALASSFVTSILLARALDTVGKGELALLLQTPSLLVTLLSLGMGTSTAYFVGRKLRSVGEAFADSMIVVLVVSVLGIPLSVLVAMSMPALDGVSTWLVFLAGLTVPLAVSLLVVTGIATGMKRVESLATRQTVATIVGLALVAAAYFSDSLTLETALGVTILSNVVSVAMTLSICWSEVWRSIARPSIARIKDAAAYSMKAYVGAVAGLLGRRQDVLILGYLSTASQVGVYSVGTVFAEILWQVSSAISTPLLARSLQEDATGGARVAAQASRIASALTLAVMLALAAVIFPLITTLYSEAFAEAAQVYLILAPGVFVYGTGSLLAQYMISHGRLFPRLSVAVALANLGLNFALIPAFGLYGASAASTVSYGIGGIYLTWAFLRGSGLRVRDVLVLRAEDVAIVRASLGSAFGRGRS